MNAAQMKAIFSRGDAHLYEEPFGRAISAMVARKVVVSKVPPPRPLSEITNWVAPETSPRASNEGCLAESSAFVLGKLQELGAMKSEDITKLGPLSGPRCSDALRRMRRFGYVMAYVQPGGNSRSYLHDITPRGIQWLSDNSA